MQTVQEVHLHKSQDVSGQKATSQLLVSVLPAAAFPRLVKHVDDGFLAQVTQLYRERIQPGRQALGTHTRCAGDKQRQGRQCVRPCMPGAISWQSIINSSNLTCVDRGRIV